MLRTKFNRPPKTPDILSRKRLVDEFNRNKYVPLTTVVAPSGYGKSIFVSQWLDQISDSYVWLSLDTQLNELSYFLLYFIEAVENEFPGSMPESKQAMQNSAVLTTRAVAETLINELNKLNQRLIFVLDDYHTINNMEIHELIGLVITNRIENLHLIIISRIDPPIPTQDLKLHNKLFSVRLKSLAFSEDELQDYLETANIPITQIDDISQLHYWSEGWILGIKLFISAHDFDKKIRLKEGDISSFLSHDLDSIVNQLYEQLPEETRYLLGIACCPNQFNLELLNELFSSLGYGENRASGFLKQIQSDNLFIIPLDSENLWYRFHHLYRELVLRQWRKDNKEADVLKKIAYWFAAHQQTHEAVNYAILGEHFDVAIELIMSKQKDVINSDKWHELKNWLELLPVNRKKNNIHLLLAELWVQHFSWNLKGSADIHAVLDKITTDDEEDSLLGEIYYHRSHHNLFYSSNPTMALAYAEKSLDLNDDTNMLGAVRILVLALSKQMLGRKKEALTDLESIMNKYPPLHIFHLRALIAKVIVLFVSGEIIAGLRASEELKFLIDGSGFNQNEGLCSYLQANGSFQVLDPNAIDQLNRTLDYFPTLNYRAYFDSFAGLVLSLQYSGKGSEAQKVLERMKARNGELKDKPFTTLTKSIEMRVHCMAGKGDQCLNWATEDLDFDIRSTTPSFAMENVILTRIRILILHGDSDQRLLGLQMLEKFNAYMTELFNEYYESEMLLIKATAHFITRDNYAAEEMLRKSLELFEINKMARPFIEMAILVPEIYSYLSKHGPLKIVSLLKRHRNSHSRLRAGNAPYIFDITLREHEIIELTAAGLRNKEIAEKLNISVVTVKSHLTHIYSKLGVNNRTSMVRLARSTELLST